MTVVAALFKAPALESGRWAREAKDLTPDLPHTRYVHLMIPVANFLFFRKPEHWQQSHVKVVTLQA
jgi:hypothetical protein